MSLPVRHFIDGEPAQRDRIAAILDDEGIKYEESLPSTIMAGFFTFTCTPEVAARLREKELKVIADFKMQMVV